jgi:hypothetical protein
MPSGEDRKALDRWCRFLDDPSQIPGIDATRFETDKTTVRLRGKDGLVFLSNAYPLARRAADVWPYRSSRREYQAFVERLRPDLLKMG